ncbi:unnamed protein product [Rotaria socialis]
MTQSLEDISILISDKSQTVKIHSEPPCLNIQEFNGVFSWKSEVPLSVENMLWSGTVIATGEVIGCVIYTGTDTRMVLNTSKPRHKFGLVDKEINTFAKLLFLGSATLALVLVILKGVDGLWYRYFVRFLLLLSYMVPLSLRVNLDLGKLVYSWFIQQDKDIPGSVVRSSTIPEELGRIGYLLADKTGTLTQNVMVFKRLYVGSGSYTIENRGQISRLLKQEYAKPTLARYESQESLATSALPFGRKRKIVKITEALRVTETIKALALCHNVTPIVEQSTSASFDTSTKYDDEYHSTSDTPRTSVTSLNTTVGSDVLELLSETAISYQASSPDEIAIVDWTERIGLTLVHRKQASLAADFSINQFSYLTRLLFVHGRDSYKRTASLSQFIIHRGVIISVMQAIFSSIFSFIAISLYQGFLLVGYGTVYTMFPVFSLVLDKDVPADIALLYPELYKELAKGRSLSLKTFSLWVLISVYQGSAIMYGAFVLFGDDFIHIVSITFTALILTELLMVALAIRTWHTLMVVGEFLSFTCYILSIVIFQNHFDIRFLESWSFIWRVVTITAISCLPLYILKYMQTQFKPPIHEKLKQYSTLK